MKTNKKFKLLFILGALAMISACKKYELDDRRYFRSPCGRVAKRWQLYKITDQKGKEYQDSVFYYKIPDNGWAIVPEQSYTYNGMILELGRSANVFCLETGIGGDAKIINKPFSSGYYEIKFKRTMFKFDLRPHENTPSRYFLHDYTIFKMTSDELIFGRGNARAYFRVMG